MSVKRQGNWLSGQRIDVPHIRALESSIANDFDLLAGQILSGEKSLVVRGFALATASAVGNPASSLQMLVGGSLILHYNASEAGTIFSVSPDAPAEVMSSLNPAVAGSFTSNTVNYVGLDLFREADDSTADTVKFITETGEEIARTVPLARVLRYRFHISTTEFTATPNVLPLCKVTTDAANDVLAVEDARPMYLRLGRGGTAPDPQHAYPWPEGRNEALAATEFTGGDKSLTSEKDWKDAVMTRLWEVGGGEHWYSSSTSSNVKMIRYGGTFPNGEHFSWDGTDLLWKEFKIVFDNSTGTHNTVQQNASPTPGLSDLADLECLYVDLDRTKNALIALSKGPLATLGSPDIPGSRIVVAWRIGADVYLRDSQYKVGVLHTPATSSSNGVVTLNTAPADPSNPKVSIVDGSGCVVAAGLTAIQGATEPLKIGQGPHDVGVQVGKFTEDVDVEGDDINVYGKKVWLTGEDTLEIGTDQIPTEVQGNLSVPATHNFKYKSPKAGRYWLSAAEFYGLKGAAVPSNDLVAPNRPILDANLGGGVGGSFRGRILVPSGAKIKSVGVMYERTSSNASSMTFGCEVSTATKNLATPWIDWASSGPVPMTTIVGNSGASGGWTTGGLAAGGMTASPDALNEVFFTFGPSGFGIKIYAAYIDFEYSNEVAVS